MLIDFDSTPFVKALGGALALTKKALQTEIAVSFVVFYQFGDIKSSTKKALRQVYADAGRRDCMTPDSPGYQTVVRRINRCAALFEHIGWRKIKRTLKGMEGADAIAAVLTMLEPLGLQTMDDVAAFTGRPRKDAEAEEQRPEEEDAEVEVIHVRTRHVDISIPKGTPARELVALANKLMKLAEEMTDQEKAGL